MAFAGGGDCTSNGGVGDPRSRQNQKANSTTAYGVSKGWASTDNNSTLPMSKAAVANLLRQMKGFVSSDVAIERNEPGENYWGVGEGPVLKGWGRLPQQQPVTSTARENHAHTESQHAFSQLVTSNNHDSKVDG